jgi:pimeloyl-ACP methyl ester carboxylesterase
MRARANGLELEYETVGDPKRPPIVLITGFAQQLVGWDERFCEQLAAGGFHVVRFDNRDIGLSTRLESAPLPNIPAIASGDTSTVAYHFEDMADDTAGLLDSLGYASAHIVGLSMGGMIAQTMTLRHPTRVKSLTSMMSTTGDRRVGYASSEVLKLIWRPWPAQREAYMEHGVRVWTALRSPGFPFDEAGVRAMVSRSYERGLYAPGAARQTAALLAQTDRTERLRQLRVPTVVIHGALDPLIHVSGGEATAAAIPGAKMLVVPGMGHDLPKGVWPVIIDAITGNAQSSP